MYVAVRQMNKWYSLFFLFIPVLLASSCNGVDLDGPTDLSSGYLAVRDVAVENQKVIAREAIIGESKRPVVEPASSLVETIILSSEAAAVLTVVDDDTPPTSPPPEITQFPEVNQFTKPMISYFRATAADADPGDTVRLEWSAGQALTVTLWHLMPTGQLGQWWDVSPIGSFEYVINPQEKNSAVFALFAGAEEDRSEMATATITLRCMDSWFFGNAPDICPAGPALSSAGAVQWFEGGLMIWAAEEDQIYALFDDDSSPGWNRYIDRWNDGEPEDDPAISTPDGLFQPIRGFGLVWRQEPGVRDRLGWAINEESGFETVVQRTSYAKYNETFILAQDGGIWRLLPERSAWEKGAAP
jgi:hypothetical protein